MKLKLKAYPNKRWEKRLFWHGMHLWFHGMKTLVDFVDRAIPPDENPHNDVTTCCLRRCSKPAEYFVVSHCHASLSDWTFPACRDHVGEMLDDVDEYIVRPVGGDNA